MMSAYIKKLVTAKDLSALKVVQLVLFNAWFLDLCNYADFMAFSSCIFLGNKTLFSQDHLSSGFCYILACLLYSETISTGAT